MRRILVGTLSLIVFLAATAGADLDARGLSGPMLIPVPVTQVTVTGEVRTPGPSVADQRLTLLAAIAQAGGFTPDAAVIEIRRPSPGAGPVTAATSASEYQTQYVLRADLVSDVANDPLLVSGDFIVVRRVLQIHPPRPAGQFGAGAFRFDWATWGVSAPVLLTSSEPRYTAAGMRLKLQGTVALEVVVKADGTVGDARVMRGLDARLPELMPEFRRIRGDQEADAVLRMLDHGQIGLDANALECVRTWTFKPGTILGKATSVVRAVSVPFRLR